MVSLAQLQEVPSKNMVLLVGPPGSGKSYLIEKIKGYPGEIGIDISQDKWWAVEALKPHEERR